MPDKSDIDSVLLELDEIVNTCERNRDRLGYFAAMYRRVTRGVKQGIDEGIFDDGPRMARLDRVFADRYFQALAAYRQGGTVPECWNVAFRAGQSRRSIILQHLLLGMNAHIFLDLGIAAAIVAKGSNYAALERDFHLINGILFRQLNPTEDRLGQLSPWIRILDWAMGDIDEWLAQGALRLFRESAWEFGHRLSRLDPQDWHSEIAQRDALAAQLGAHVAKPRFLERVAIAVVGCVETSDVARGIQVLS